MTEFETEKTHMQNVINIINKILEEQKLKYNKMLQIRNNLSGEDMKRGEALLANTLMAGYKEEMRQLESLLPSPYFGNFKFKMDGKNEPNNIYIGKFNVMDGDRIYVTDWRAPVCSLYYDGELGEVSYNAPAGKITGELESKRQIVIKNGQLVSVVDTTTVTSDALLQPYLNSKIDNNMKTIIASIQKEQNEIIRYPDKNIVVQGVAGSGKTSVALHRIAYLLYAQKENIKPENFLVIGPNKYFLKYISTVLPDLATTTVDEMTLVELMNDFLGTKIELEDEVDKNNSKQLRLQKKISLFKGSRKYISLIDSYIEECKKGNALVSEDFKIFGKTIFTKEEILDSLISSYGTGINFENTYKHFKQLFKEKKRYYYYKLNEEYEEIYTRIPIGDPTRNIYIEKSNQLSKEIENNGEKLLNRYFKSITKNCIQLYIDFICNLDELKTGLSTEELKKLKNDTLKTLKKKKVLFEDVAPLIYINTQLSNKRYSFTNVVIDEAQDYSEFTFHTLKNLFNKAKFNIYGDIAQGIKSYRGITSWDVVVNDIFNAECKYFELNRSYRSTMEITNVANNILNCLNLSEATPVIRRGGEVVFEETSNMNKVFEKLDTWKNEGHKIIAIICKNDIDALNVQEKLSKYGIDINYFNKDSEQYGDGVLSLSVETSKGLEFDCTIVYNASPEVYNYNDEVDMKLLYVALTRALHEELILYDKELVLPLRKELGRVRKL